MFLSFIVPVYKTGAYLERCISTLINQDIDDYEILLIDDGSPDDSGDKCDEIAKKSDKIKVFHKNNEGLGFTRNYGIKYAKGDYLIFIDSDDYFKINILESLKKHIEQENSDIVVYSYTKMRNGIEIKKNKEKFPINNNSINGKIYYDNKKLACMSIGEPLKKDGFEVGPAWKEMWKRKFIVENQLSFPSERVVLSEDYIFATKAFSLANKVSYFDDILYYYCYNENSLTNTYNPTRANKAVIFFNEIEKIIICQKLGYDAIIRNENNFMISMIQSFKHIVLDKNAKFSMKIKNIKNICVNLEIKSLVRRIKYYDTFPIKLLHRMIKYKQYLFIYFIIWIRYKSQKRY